jgi:beta-lactamase regulating signal transducer with metallopeptidase domain
MIILALATFDLHRLAQVPTTSLLNTAVEGLAIAALAWTLLRLAGRLNSGTRFAVWFLALLSIAALPFFSSSAMHRIAATGVAPITISSTSALYLFSAWASISVVLFGRLGLGLLQMRKLRRNATPIDPANLPTELYGIFEQEQTSRRIQLCVNDKVQAPAAFGFLKPAIVVPSWTLRDLPPEELKVILLHEMAHLRRWDDWTNLLQKIVKAVFFFHPAVWWIEHRLALEREMACDDMVLAQTVSPKAYAASLISFAEKIQRGRELALAQSVVGRMRQITYRVTQILDTKRPSATSVWKPALGAVALLSAAALVATPYAPQLVAFEDSAPAVTAQANRNPPSFSVTNQAQHNVVPTRLKVRTTATVIPARAKAPARKPLVVRTSLDQQQTPAPVLVFMQSTQVEDASGSAIWTYCVWQVSGANGSRRQIETFVVHSI